MIHVPKLTLSYFNFGGRGEPLRLACAIGQVPFYHRAVAFSEWKTVKPTLPLGQVPCLEIGDDNGDQQVLVHSNAILRYLGTLGGLYPTNDPLKAAKIDMVMETVAELLRPIEATVQGAPHYLIDDKPFSAEQVQSIRTRLISDEKRGLPLFFGLLEKQLHDNNGDPNQHSTHGYWLVGDSVTIADLSLHQVTLWIGSGKLDHLPASVMDQYPALVRHHAAVEALEAVQTWRKEHPVPYESGPVTF